jgi:hypothetical protein
VTLPKIYVMDRGWVIVGVPRKETKTSVTLDLCHVVRNWGTKKGLGELALKGPTDQTVLDLEGNDVQIYTSFILRAIPCSPEGWATWCL